MTQSTINLKGTLFSLSKPCVMGILNVTDNSFYDGGKYQDSSAAIEQARRMHEAGAAIIDVGGASSKPGAEEITVSDEMARVLPVIEELTKTFPEIIISIDTYRSDVAEAAIKAGAAIVNDISFGELDPRMFKTVADLGVPYIGMHMQGTPKTMQKNPSYSNVVAEVLEYVARRKDDAVNAGIKDVIIDPGFGFGKTVDHNYEILASLNAFKAVGSPILVGLSRKSMVTRVLNIDPSDALTGTIALNMAALERGAQVLRVHDVVEAVEVIRIYGRLQGEKW